MRRRVVFDRFLMERLRKGKGWKLRDLERETGLSNAYLSQLETGRTKNPTLEASVAIADAFGLELETFVLRLKPAHPTPARRRGR